MHDFIQPKENNKEKKYINLISQITNLIKKEEDIVAILSNTSAAIAQTFNWLWVGFYIVKKNVLVLGPFQGPVACFQIKKGDGVCGKSWESQKTIIVPDVDKFPGHIACSSDSRSEIVIPIFNKGNVFGVLDIDSKELNSFSKLDEKYLNKIVRLIENKLS